MDAPMRPKGKLLIIGGAEDLGDEHNYPKKSIKTNELDRFEILRELIQASKKKKIEIVTTGSNVQDEVKKRYQRAFHKLGYSHPGFIPIADKLEAHDEHYIARAKEARAIFFTGGDQFRISTILGGTPFIEVIKERYINDRDFLVAGTSAGAMVMSTVMITRGGMEEAFFGRDLKTASGL